MNVTIAKCANIVIIVVIVIVAINVKIYTDANIVMNVKDVKCVLNMATVLIVNIVMVAVICILKNIATKIYNIQKKNG